MTTVYVGARDLADVMAFGTHQFLVIDHTSDRLPVFSHPYGGPVGARALGGGHTGHVFGTHNTGRLTVKFFEEADWLAAREHFDPDVVKWYRSDWDVELKPVMHSGSPEAFAARVLLFTRNYIFNEADDRIPYVFHQVNSNSWAQSLIAAAGGRVSSNFRGLDLSHNKRLPPIYFQAICPIRQRPRVNQ